MGRFEVQTEVIHADWWDKGEEVVIKERTWADDQKLASLSLAEKGIRLKDAGELKRIVENTTLDLAAMNAHMMLLSIQSWTFTDGNGAPAPITRASIEQLSREDGEFIMEAIVALNPQRDEDFPADS